MHDDQTAARNNPVTMFATLNTKNRKFRTVFMSVFMCTRTGPLLTVKTQILHRSHTVFNTQQTLPSH